MILPPLEERRRRLAAAAAGACTTQDSWVTAQSKLKSSMPEKSAPYSSGIGQISSTSTCLHNSKFKSPHSKADLQFAGLQPVYEHRAPIMHGHPLQKGHFQEWLAVATAAQKCQGRRAEGSHVDKCCWPQVRSQAVLSLPGHLLSRPGLESHQNAPPVYPSHK